MTVTEEPVVEEPVELGVDARVGGHVEVSAVDLEVVGAGVQAGAPLGDAVEAGVDGGELDVGCGVGVEVVEELRRAVAVRAAGVAAGADGRAVPAGSGSVRPDGGGVSRQARHVPPGDRPGRLRGAAL